MQPSLPEVLVINAFLQLSGLVLVGIGSTYFGNMCSGGGATGFRCDRLGTHQHTWVQIGLRVNLSRDRNTHSTYVWLHSSSQDSSIP